ncbi:type I restriction endonuclease subunit R [Candidatus Poribacteria bacterium]|nr:type I restriction endonuclease subunit R [Candidatus Poribacteria bacterium]MYK96535.1 type I restriction endonuclease subunit R [Candidatus Poribacteria bacterium]
MLRYTETDFEDHIEQRLHRSGYRVLQSYHYDKPLCLIPSETLQFIQDTQPDTYQKLKRQYGEDTPDKLLDRINKQIERRGVLDVLRKGIKDRGCDFTLTYFLPSSGMNPDHQKRYAQNRFSLIRQLHYSEKNEKSLDMTLFLNGLPLVTMELKNSLTSQVFTDAEKQYRADRDPREPLFQFKRCLVHFAVGNEKVSMTTHLQGGKTRFFPFNKDIENPVNPEGHKTAYLWEDILQPNNLMELINNFIHEQETTEKVYDDKISAVKDVKHRVLVFPRYHQLDVIRELEKAIKKEGVGYNYLIQHTTGSGKSNSIAWLAHLLTHLFSSSDTTNRIFDSIIVVTDRRLLDKQLQDTIKQVGQVEGVVHAVDKNSAQLRGFLESGKDIIISTIQKFSVIAEEIGKLKSKTFAVIIDEAHSSQSGESARNLRLSLSQGIELGVTEDDADEISDIDAKILEVMEQRRMQDHISYFGFSGTPKNKTLELFGQKDEEGIFVPFHPYSMRQSISEGFTLDVLQNYTTFKRYFELVKSVSENKAYEKARTLRALTNYVDLQHHSIETKTRIMLEHFIEHTAKTIEGKGRAMLVTSSRLHCVRYKQAFDRQMKQMGLSYGCLVAFSDTVHDTDNGQDYTENGMNALPPSTSIADSFKDPQYRILIVASKFQTGFDEPMLQTMYVDKRLDGLQCVQTLSRLNRVATGKTDTLVLDFVNEPEQIQEAFQEYYQTTMLAEETDPNRLYDLQSELEGFDLYDEATIDEFCLIFYDPDQPDELLQGVLDDVVEQWSELERDDREAFRSTLQSYIRRYGYISQLMTFSDVALEKLYVFSHSLNKKLPKREHSDLQGLLDSVDLDSFRVQKTHENLQLSLEEGDSKVEGFSGDVVPRKDPEQDFLSNILDALNSAYHIDFTPEDKVDIQTIHRKVHENEELRQVIEGDNSETNKRYKFDQVVEDILLDFVNNKLELYTKLSKPEINADLKQRLYQAYLEQSSSPV